MIGARYTWHSLLILQFLLAPVMAGEQSELGTVSDPRIDEAIALMDRFAERTGLTSTQSPRRYLWTDAFAVCNYLGLARGTGDQHYNELAMRLVDQVHHTLGRHRTDDKRSGWISGLNKPDGEKHPTRGGLRIGKPLPERAAHESVDERLEWDRDGQYFHYLTKWMHALDQAARSTGRAQLNLWARELARTSIKAFTVAPVVGRPRRMVWKMSIDLTRALVPSMGQHDPLEGYVTSLQLHATAASLPQPALGPELTDEIRQLAPMIQGEKWVTRDPLGIGGLLVDAYRVAQLMTAGGLPDEGLPERLLVAALAGLQSYARTVQLEDSAEYRLAFRELGLAIGLNAATRMWEAGKRGAVATNPAMRSMLEMLLHYASLGEEIESFWRNPANQSVGTWSEHRDINEVMLATLLLPEGFLVLGSPK